jgi:hypothetical protein
MKSLLLIGGIAGFVFGNLFSYLHQQPLVTCLWHGGLASLFVSLLLPWWGYSWSSQYKETARGHLAAGELGFSATSTQSNASRS